MEIEEKRKRLDEWCEFFGSCVHCSFNCDGQYHSASRTEKEILRDYELLRGDLRSLGIIEDATETSLANLAREIENKERSKRINDRCRKMHLLWRNNPRGETNMLFMRKGRKYGK